MERDQWDHLHAVGEAIGNVGRWLFPRRRQRREAEQTLRRWLARVPVPQVAAVAASPRKAQTSIIEGTWREITDEGEQR